MTGPDQPHGAAVRPRLRPLPLVLLAAAASLALALALVLAPGYSQLALPVYLLALATILVVALARLVSRTYPSAPDDLASLVRVAAPAQARPEDLEQAERWMMFATSSAADLHFSLRPVLSEIAAQRLAVRRNVDLALQPDEARRILGAAAWDLVRPDRPEPGRFERGIPVTALHDIIATLEAI